MQSTAHCLLQRPCTARVEGLRPRRPVGRLQRGRCAHVVRADAEEQVGGGAGCWGAHSHAR